MKVTIPGPDFVCLEKSTDRYIRASDVISWIRQCALVAAKDEKVSIQVSQFVDGMAETVNLTMKEGKVKKSWF